MDFTREPIIETVITPKEGCKLVVRSSKSAGQEEHFVDAVEVVSFGASFFFRSLERPKAFLVPASDYEVLEVREARMVLKNVGLERSIKIGGGREAAPQKPQPREPQEKEPEVQSEAAALQNDPRSDKKRDRRRQLRRRRGGREDEPREADDKVALPSPHPTAETETAQPIPPPVFTSLLPPPMTLISETLSRYKEDAQFKGAFYSKEEAGAPTADQEDELARHRQSEVASEPESSLEYPFGQPHTETEPPPSP